MTMDEIKITNLVHESGMGRLAAIYNPLGWENMQYEIEYTEPNGNVVIPIRDLSHYDMTQFVKAINLLLEVTGKEMA